MGVYLGLQVTGALAVRIAARAGEVAESLLVGAQPLHQVEDHRFRFRDQRAEELADRLVTSCLSRTTCAETG